MMRVDAMPGGNGPWPKECLSWLSALGCTDELAEEVAASAPPFAPHTLKQVLTAVMDLGRRAGRLGETMALLGHQEAAFKRLREELGIPRAAPPTELVPAVVLVPTANGWMAPGGWVPDLLDRAAGHDMLCDSGAPPRPVTLSDVEQTGAMHVFVLVPNGMAPTREVPGAPMARIHRIETSDAWLRPGPSLPHAVFDAASRMHGISAVFS